MLSPLILFILKNISFPDRALDKLLALE